MIEALLTILSFVAALFAGAVWAAYVLSKEKNRLRAENADLKTKLERARNREY